MIDFVLFWHYASIFVASNEQVEFDIANKNIKKNRYKLLEVPRDQLQTVLENSRSFFSISKLVSNTLNTMEMAQNGSF